ncbi:MAG: ATP-binding cassette domain-containing protein [Acidobacteriota bacterium]|nr:ATP-binding cassette domain-containing protein [Acidobacteriota bacterium]
MFELRGVTKRYDALTALHRLDLRVDAGSTLVLIGPSGSGKSTLLRLLSGLDAPSEGTVHFENAPFGPRSPAPLRQRIGFVVQGGGLFPHLTARDNAAIVARHLGWDAARREARVQELAALVRLPASALDRYPVQLSGGQAQRVSLMRALMLDPGVLMFDEPLGALDPITRYELQTDLREVFRRLHRTVIIVTHDLGEAAFFADRILLMKDGHVLQDGTPRDLIERPADDFAARFVRAQRAPAASGTRP